MPTLFIPQKPITHQKFAQYDADANILQIESSYRRNCVPQHGPSGRWGSALFYRAPLAGDLGRFFAA